MLMLIQSPAHMIPQGIARAIPECRVWWVRSQNKGKQQQNKNKNFTKQCVVVHIILMMTQCIAGCRLQVRLKGAKFPKIRKRCRTEEQEPSSPRPPPPPQPATPPRQEPKKEAGVTRLERVGGCHGSLWPPLAGPVPGSHTVQPHHCSPGFQACSVAPHSPENAKVHRNRPPPRKGALPEPVQKHQHQVLSAGHPPALGPGRTLGLPRQHRPAAAPDSS